MCDTTQIVLVSLEAHCRVYLDDKLVSHLTGFSTKDGWVDQIHIDSDGKGDISYPVDRWHGKVEAIFDPPKEKA